MCEEAEFAYSEAAVGDSADAGAFYRFDGQAHPEKHPADLAVKPFGYCYLDKRLPRTSFEYFHRRTGGFALGEPDAFFEAFCLRAFDSAFDLGDIGLGQAVSGVGEAVGQLGIVCKDNQACCVDIQPADAEDAMPGWDEVDCLCSSLRVKVGADDALWLVEQEINLWLRPDSFAHRCYYVFVGVGEYGQSVHHFAIDLDKAFED